MSLAPASRFALTFALVTTSSIAAVAAPANAPAPASPDTPSPQEHAKDEKKGALVVAATPVLPVGNLSDAVSVGLGGVLGLDYAVHPNVSLLARAGYIHHLAKPGLDISLGALPLWGGARYSFLGAEGPYVEGTIGPTVLFASVATRFGRVSDSETKLSFGAGAGYRFERLDLGARFVFYDIGRAGDSAGLMATVGWSFLAF